MLWKTPNKEGVLVLRMFAPDADWGKDSQGTGRGREDGDGRTKSVSSKKRSVFISAKDF